MRIRLRSWTIFGLVLSIYTVASGPCRLLGTRPIFLSGRDRPPSLELVVWQEPFETVFTPLTWLRNQAFVGELVGSYWNLFDLSKSNLSRWRVDAKYRGLMQVSGRP
jgi:hypothetical protein